MRRGASRLQNSRMSVLGAIIAGGKGERLGGDKPLAPFRGRTLIEAVIERAAPQVDALALNVIATRVPRLRELFRDRFEFVCDTEAGDIGPLAGILASLLWAKGHDATWLATFPADTPFLPRDLVGQLLESAPAAAHDGARIQGLCAIWPIDGYQHLLDAVRDNGLRSPRDAIILLGGKACKIRREEHAFFNVNSPDDLAQAERIAAHSS